MTPPLAGLRIVVTIPPHTWFGGVDFNFAIEMTEELRTLGAAVLELDTGGFVVQNSLHVQHAIETIRSFRPDVAMSLPNSSYALLCRNVRGENVFRDILALPTIMLWDHGLFQFPKSCFDPFPKTPGEGQLGALARLRATMDHPLYHHYSPDQGHVDALDALGVISRDKVRVFLQPPYPNFVAYGYRQPPSDIFRTPLAFAGNVYLNAAADLPFAQEPRLKDLQERALGAKTERLTIPLWQLLVEGIESLAPTSRSELGLVPDSTFFWGFLHDEVEVIGNTRVRLHVLTGLRREFDFYGNFVEPNAVGALRTQYRLKVRRSLDYFTELPLLFMNSDVIVDVVNLGYNTGISPKIMGCLACGGLILFDYKEDFARAMGDAGEQVMYRSMEELNTLVDRYRSDPARRRDLSRYLQHQAATRFSFGSLCRQILVDEPTWRN